jgi:hypothetical protein
LLTDYGEWQLCQIGMGLEHGIVAVLLIPIASTIVRTLSALVDLFTDRIFKGKRYNITNEALIGACFLPAGLGNLSA